MKRFTTLMIALLFVTGAAFADAAEDGKSLSVRTFTFKHKPAEKAATAVKGLISSDGSMAIQPTANSLVITDRPENIRKIAAAIEQFDKPAQSFRLSVRLVSAGRVPAAEAARVPDDLKEVAAKMAVLRYNTFELVGDASFEGKEGGAGLLQLDGFRADFKLGEYDQSSDSVRLEEFKLLRQDKDQLAQILKTTLNLKIGQTVILGATRQPQSDRALMMVLTAKR